MVRSSEQVNELNTNGGFYTEQEMKDILKWPVMLFLNLDLFPLVFFEGTVF